MAAADLVALERDAVVAYAELAERGLPAREGRRFRDHAERHVEGLGARLEPLPRPAAIGGLASVHGRAEALRFAIRLETRTVAAYHRELGELRDPRKLLTAAQIMANHGQHLAVLRPLAGRPPVPSAFATG